MLSKLVFPGVTICNYNRINCPQLWTTLAVEDNTTQTYETLLQMTVETGCPMCPDKDNNFTRLIFPEVSICNQINEDRVNCTQLWASLADLDNKSKAFDTLLQLAVSPGSEKCQICPDNNFTNKLFGEVSICNANNTVDCDQLKTELSKLDNKTKTYDVLLHQYNDPLLCPPPSPPTTTTTTASAEAGRKKRSADPGGGGDPTLGDTPDFLNSEYKFLELYMGLDEDTRSKIGHQFDDFIKECTFRGMDCTNIR